MNRGHSLTSTVEKFSGIQIDVRKLNGITILKEKAAVRLQAGAFNWEVIKTLWDGGYVTSPQDFFPDSKYPILSRS